MAWKTVAASLVGGDLIPKIYEDVKGLFQWSQHNTHVTNLVPNKTVNIVVIHPGKEYELWKICYNDYKKAETAHGRVTVLLLDDNADEMVMNMVVNSDTSVIVHYDNSGNLQLSRAKYGTLRTIEK